EGVSRFPAELPILGVVFPGTRGVFPMRVATVMGVLLLGGAASLSAQHAHQFELGGFASYTRFDRAFLLDNQIGGGGRLGFWITDWLGIEGDGLYMRPKPTGGGSGANFPVAFASGGQVVGSAGLSFFLGPSPREKSYPEIPKPRRDSIVAAGGKVPEAQPRAAGPTYERRSSDWQHKWYWGGQGGLMVFRTNYDSYSF